MRVALTAAAFVVACLVAVSPAGASVRKLEFTGVVAPNGYAKLVVQVSPATKCKIKVTYDTVVSSAKGLGPKTGSKVTWRWKVGSTTNAGRWPVQVDCGESGKLTLRLRVTP